MHHFQNNGKFHWLPKARLKYKRYNIEQAIVFDNHLDWEVIPQPIAHIDAAQMPQLPQAVLRFRKAVRKIKTVLRIRLLWARIGHMLNRNRTLRLHTTRRHDVLSSVWRALRPNTWKYALLFTHLKRTNGILHYK